MKTKKLHSATRGFTLLELVVVLAILAIVTALATRMVSHVDDQRRFESSQQGLDEIEAAVLGSDKDRAIDGSRTVSGFVADMGRLPRAVLVTKLSSDDSEDWTLQELWSIEGSSGLLPPFDVRQATALNLSDPADVDPQVWVPGGWRGPYLHLPTGTRNLLDGWGNGYSNARRPTPTDFSLARLLDVNGAPIADANTAIVAVRHLGANGVTESAEKGYDVGFNKAFSSDLYTATKLVGNVEVLNGSSPAAFDPSGTDTVTVKVFCPNPVNAAQILVLKTEVAFTSNPVSYAVVPLPGHETDLTIGPRVVRAYFNDKPPLGTTSNNASAVKNVTLRPGVNQLDLTVDRVKAP